MEELRRLADSGNRDAAEVLAELNGELDGGDLHITHHRASPGTMNASTPEAADGGSGSTSAAGAEQLGVGELDERQRGLRQPLERGGAGQRRVFIVGTFPGEQPHQRM